MAIHIGHEIETELHRQGKTASWLAEKLEIQRPNVYRIFASPSCDTSLLMKISLILKKDFFNHLSSHLKI